MRPHPSSLERFKRGDPSYATEEVPLLDWRIIAAAIAAIGVLAGGTLLAAQVEGDLEDGVEQRVRETDLTPVEDKTPLKLNDFKLPRSMPLDIPPGTKISPDLSKLTLPEDMDVQLPDDLDLSGLNFTLPEDFTLELPPGTEFSAPDLKLPEGATIKLPDGRQFKIPPGSDITLPPELVERLLAEGLPAGTLPAGRSISVNDLPPGLQAQLDPPEFDGKGSLHLPAGTTIALPDGTRFPFPAGALAYAARYLLPPGTTFDIPFDAIGSPGGAFPVPVPHDNAQLRREGGGPTGIAVETEITSMPARVRKGEPITVSGYVREAATGRPIAGAPVDVFMNESKRAPGVLVGQATSDASGTFVAKLVLPADKPARDYQLVNHAAAFTDASGRRYADGWGDPPFATYATTNLSLILPETDGFGASTTIAGALLDNTGVGVPGATIIVSVDGGILARPLTGSSGEWSVAHTFTAGTHTVSARFGGTANYEASTTVTDTIEIEDYAIAIAPIVRAKPGEGIQLRGTVLYKGGPADGRTVLIQNVFSQGDVEVPSNLDGSFSYAFATSRTQPPGTYTLTYSLPAHGVTKTQAIELNQTGQITLTAPSSWDVERPVPVSVRLQSPEGNAIPMQNMRLTLSGPGGSRDVTGVTDGRGAFSAEISPLRATGGSYTLVARVTGSPNLDAPSVSHAISLGAFEVTWDLPATVVRGQELAGAATMRLNGKPVADATALLDVFGPIQGKPDLNGVVRFSVKVPTVATLGTQTVTLTAGDHPPRSTTLEVVALPKLSIDAPAEFEAGSSPEARVTLTDDQGDPIRSSAVTLTITTPSGVQRTVVTTDAAGRWRGPVNVTGVEEGNVTLAARYDGGGAYLSDEDVRTMAAVAPSPFAGGAPWWLLPLVGVALAGGGGAAWWYVKRRPRRVPVQAAVNAAPVAAVVERPSDITLAFGIPDGEPAVWGVGEPLELRARNHAEGGTFQLAWPGGATTLALAEDADAATTLTFPEEGEVTIRAQRQGGEFVPVSASVRIVDYRKETAREFDLFLDKARALDGSLTKRSTPREISWTLEMRLAPEAREHLEEIASVLEITNYSHYDVSRAHYLRFVRAARALDAFFAPPATQGG